MVQFTSGQKTDSRTLAMLKEAEKQSGCPIVVVQGSWSNGKYSAGTHSGAGVVDIRVWNQSSPAAIDSLELWLRRVGFAAWYRTIGSGPHIHAVAIGADGLHWSAANQVKSYYNGRDGLAANGKDPGPRLNPIPTWESYNKDQTLPDTGGDWLDMADREDVVEAAKEGFAKAIAEAASRNTTYGRHLGTNLKDALVNAGLDHSIAKKVSGIKVLNRVDGKTYPLDVAMSSGWWYEFLAGVAAANGGAIPARYAATAAKAASGEINVDETEEK